MKKAAAKIAAAFLIAGSAPGLAAATAAGGHHDAGESQQRHARAQVLAVRRRRATAAAAALARRAAVDAGVDLVPRPVSTFASVPPVGPVSTFASAVLPVSAFASVPPVVPCRPSRQSPRRRLPPPAPPVPVAPPAPVSAAPPSVPAVPPAPESAAASGAVPESVEPPAPLSVVPVTPPAPASEPARATSAGRAIAARAGVDDVGNDGEGRRARYRVGVRSCNPVRRVGDERLKLSLGSGRCPWSRRRQSWSSSWSRGRTDYDVVLRVRRPERGRQCRDIGRRRIGPLRWSARIPRDQVGNLEAPDQSPGQYARTGTSIGTAIGTSIRIRLIDCSLIAEHVLLRRTETRLKVKDAPARDRRG